MSLTEEEYAELLKQGNVREIVQRSREEHEFTRQWHKQYLHQCGLLPITEAHLQNQLRQVCKTLGLLHYHTYRSQKSEPGFPDSVIVSPTGGTLWLLELKREGETPTIPQQAWLNALDKVTNVVSGVVHPDSLSAWVQHLRG